MSKAKNNTRNTEVIDENSEVLVVSPPAPVALAASDPMEFIATAKSLQLGDYEVEYADELLTLEEGNRIFGTYLGSGTATIEDKETKEMKEVSNHSIQLLNPTTMEKGPRVSILGAAQLDRKLESLVSSNAGMLGFLVVIERGRDVRNGQRIMTRYEVAQLRPRK